MTQITVVIQGMIMLVASTVYQGSSSTDTGAAIAIEASDGRTPGSYGIDIPPHVALLTIPHGAVKDPAPPILKFVSAYDYYAIPLNGVHLQFGTYASGSCVPIKGSGAKGPLTGVPDLSKVVANSTIASDARPDRNLDYKNINRKRVAGWFDIPDGTLTTPKSSSSMEAEFRPSLHKYQSVPYVTWSIPVDTPCMIITPFGEMPSVVQLNSASPITISYENTPKLPQMASMLSAMHRRRGASYDYELMYHILAVPPSVPPVPYLLRPDPDTLTVEQLTEEIQDVFAKRLTDVKTGINCGPGGNPHP